MLALRIRAGSARQSNTDVHFRLRARPDGLELSTGARFSVIPNSALKHATMRRALIAPCMWIYLKEQVDVHRLGPVSALRISARPWHRRELQRYVDEVNERVYDRNRLEPS